MKRGRIHVVVVGRPGLGVRRRNTDHMALVCIMMLGNELANTGHFGG